MQTFYGTYRELADATPLLDQQGRLTSLTRAPIYDFFFPLFGDTTTLLTLTPHYLGFQMGEWELGAIALPIDVQILQNTEISYLKQGPQRRQTLTLQWKNAGFGNDISQKDYFNAQLTLYEETGCMELVFGGLNIAYPERYVGLNFYRHSVYDEKPTHAAGLSGVPSAAFLGQGGHLWGVPSTGTKYQICQAQYLARHPVISGSSSSIGVYPNPVSGVARLDLPPGRYDCKIYDALGNLVARPTGEFMDASEWSVGLYVLVVENPETGQRFIHKFAKR
jgi:hypothetical protein